MFFEHCKHLEHISEQLPGHFHSMNLFLQNYVSNLKPLETGAEVVIQSQKDAWKENSAGGSLHTALKS